jgi:hypothetical protein
MWLIRSAGLRNADLQIGDGETAPPASNAGLKTGVPLFALYAKPSPWKDDLS